ncbi:hypothetical protein [Hippea maritima]|uniref:Sporulation domain-containing protein n=1 Tax=Hippea maritima (strain ATCC 700847 / DSM 10411 / MH2) TaxID=760142 RepID=F2LXQ5_HIPMA|nr:hypothetical protein [Hippea maritima]AEA34296.1 hypothetical protein Hipma_1339 [Hippea maritima DSM 10411]
MIRLNLIKNQLPIEIDLPKSIKNRQKAFIAAVGLSILILLAPAAYYIFKLIKTTNKQPEKVTLKVEKPGKKEAKTKPPISLQQKKSKPKKEVQTKKAVNFKPLKGALFKIEIALEDIPKNSFSNQTTTALPPLPPSLKPLPPKQKIDNKTKQNKSQIYEVKIKTPYKTKLQNLLNKLGIHYTTKSFKKNSKTIYDVYIGGLYSYPDVLKFAKILKSKGYRVYSITNLNLLFYVCVDKKVNKKKAVAYQQAWAKTSFKLILKKRTTQKTYYEFSFATEDKNIIKTLKKNGFWPIIRQIKNGA